MRKLFPVPTLASLAIAPVMIAAAAPVPFPTADLEERPTGLESRPPDGNLIVSSSLAGDPFDPAEARAAHRTATRRAVREARSEAPVAPKVSVPPQLEAIASCESGGDPSAVSSSGEYRGKYQFSSSAWEAAGGSGDPAAAPEAEQDRRAAVLYAQSGPGQWPACAQ